MNIRATIKSYESIQLNQVLEERLHPGGHELTVRMAEVAGLGRGSHLLDVGCGRGTSILFFSKHYGCTGMGVDLSPMSIAFASERCLAEGLAEEVKFMAADAVDLPCADNQFDVVFSECTLSLVPDKAAVLREMARVVKPGGMVVVSDIVLGIPLTDEFKKEVGFTCCFTEALTADRYQEYAVNAGLNLVLVEDFSTSLTQIAFKLSMGYGSLNEFWTQFGQGKMPCCNPGSPSSTPGANWKEIFKQGKPGYWLLAWQKPIA